MGISLDLVIAVLLLILVMSAPPGLSLVLPRVLMKDGFPLESKESRAGGIIISLFCLVMFLSVFLSIFFSGKATMPDRLRVVSITFSVLLALVIAWLLLILAVRSKLWAKQPDFTKRFPLHCFFLVYICISCAVLFLYHFRKYFEMGLWSNDSSQGAGSLTDRGSVLATLIPPPELSTTLLGMLALSAPVVLSLVLFRVLVKDGVPLDNQAFRKNHCFIFLIFWPAMFFPGLFAILSSDGYTASMPDKLRAASITCAGSLVPALCWFLLMLALRRKLWAKLPDFTKAFPRHFFYLFHLVPGSWAVLLGWGVWLSWVAFAPP